MATAPQRKSAPCRPPMQDPKVLRLDRARARVIAAKGPSLGELAEKFKDWPGAEVSGKVNKKSCPT